MNRMAVACLITLTFTGGSIASEPTEAAKIIDEYLTLPHVSEKEDLLGKNRLARVMLLRRLGTVPDQAVDAVRNALPVVSDGRQACELIEMLGRQVSTPECATLLSELLDHPDDCIRRSAVGGLRLMARKVDRRGWAMPMSEHKPIVLGLVPFLVKAAEDSVAHVRRDAVWALADSRDSAAPAALRKRLADEDWNIRFDSACLLTEFADTSGLHLLVEVLDSLSRPGAEESFSFHLRGTSLLHALERATGHSEGEIPPPYTIWSDIRRAQEAKQQMHGRVQAWAAWFAEKRRSEEAGGTPADTRQD